MKREPLSKSIAVAIALVLAYAASYAGIRFVRPEFLNTNDGPVAAFNTLYYPLRYIDAQKPEWYSRTQDHWLVVQDTGNNRGNGYLYFSWDGREYRVFFGGDLDGIEEGQPALVHFRYELETWDDFRNRLMPTIDQVKPAPAP